MPEIGPTTREENLERLAKEAFDVCVVGGGITGAGIALDAASRGLAVALLERDDFASGTSSKSSKLIHGGLRYLANYEFGLTWEAVRERNLLRRLAPHIVRPVPFLYPVFRSRKEARLISIGLNLYDGIAGVRGLGRHRRADATEIKRLAPSLAADRVVAAWTYWDARADDARLVLEVLRTAHRFGAAIANHCAVVGFDRAAGRIAAALVEDRTGRGRFAVRARAFVNAGGVWAERVARLDDEASAPGLRPAKGIHLLLRAEQLPLEAACIVPSPARDRRSVFAVPWGPRVLVGTTDTDYAGALDSPSVDADDVDYVLGGINRWFGLGLSAADVVSGYAGLRPLRTGGAERTADLSRRHAVGLSPSGLITITGGKLTTFRRMAAEAVDIVCRELGIRTRSRTSRIRLGSADRPADTLAAARRLAVDAGLDPGVADGLTATHGDRSLGVLALAAEEPALAAPAVPGLPTLLAELRWAVRHEMALTLDDALTRRTRLALLDRDGGLAEPGAIGRALGMDAERLAEQTVRYAEALQAERGVLPSPQVGNALPAADV